MGFGSNKGFTPGGDGAGPSGIESDAVIADDAVVRGDGGARKVQDSSWTITDAGALGGGTSVSGSTTLSGQNIIVDGDIGVTGDTDLIVPTSGTVTFNIGDVAGSDLKIINAGGTSVLHVEGDTQRVGIGNTAPATELHIGDAADTVKQVITLQNVKGKAEIGVAGGGGDIISTAGHGDLVISNEFSTTGGGGKNIRFGIGTGAGSEAMIISGSKKVGIGTVAPGTLLQLEGADAYLTLKNSTNEHGDGEAETRIIFEDHSNAALAQIQGSHDGTVDDTKGDLIFSTHNGTSLAENMRITSDGYVGIGLIHPGVPLHVESNLDYLAKFESTDSFAGIILEDNASTNNGNVLAVSGDNMRLYTAGSERVRIGSTGLVGIGTNNPGTLLQLEGADAYLTLKNSTNEHDDGDAETRIIFEDHSNTALAQIQASHDGNADNTRGDLIFSTNDGTSLTEAIRINRRQFVGIGTAEPGGSSTAGILNVEGDPGVGLGSATEGGNIRLSANDGAAIGDTHRLGVIEFAARDNAGGAIAVGAKIEAIAAEAWDATNNAANLDFYTSDGDEVQTKRMSILATGDVDLNYATANAPGGGFDGSGLVYKTTVAKVNGLIETQIWIDLGASVPASHKDLTNAIIGESGVAAAYITQLTNAVNGFIIRAEAFCLETPVAGGATGEADIGIGASSDSIAAGTVYTSATNQSLLAFTGPSGVAAAGAARTGDQNTMAAGLNNLFLYVYMAKSGQSGSSTAAYTAGQFLIKLYGVDNIV